MEIDIRKYLKLAVRWWWLLAVSTIIPMAVSYYFVSRQPDLYQAKVTLMVGTSLQSANPDPRLMDTSSTLAAAYRQLLTYDPITEAVIERLGLERSPVQLASQISTWIYPEAQLLEIRVVDGNPRAAALIANALAEELIARTPASDAVQQFEAGFTRRQLDDLRVRVEKVQADIEELSASMLELTSAAEIQDAQERLNGLRTLESMYQSTYAQLLSSYIGDSPNILRIFDPAIEPRYPMGRKTVPIVAIAGAAGLGLAVAAVFLIEYLDDGVRWEGEMRQSLLGMPVLGALSKVQGWKGSIVEVFDPEAPSVEMARALRTNIFLATDGQGLRSLLITSPSVRAGKTFTVAWLGQAIAAGGNRVILVDADLRKPVLHEFFDLPNLLGLSELLAGDAPLRNSDWPKGVLETGVENLYLLPGGKPPLDPGWLLSSPRVGELFGVLKEQADVILIDSPPVLAAPDTVVLATAADWTLLVVSAGVTRCGNTLKAKERLAKRHEVKLLGVAFNRVKISGDSTYYRGYGVKRRQSQDRLRDRLGARLPLIGDRAVTKDGQVVLKPAEIGDYLGVSQAVVRRWCRSGRLPAFKSWFQWRVKEEDLQAAIEGLARVKET